MVFDYDRLRDLADYAHPTAPPIGIGEVIVNGRIALDQGGYTGAKSGRVLRHRCPTAGEWRLSGSRVNRAFPPPS